MAEGVVLDLLDEHGSVMLESEGGYLNFGTALWYGLVATGTDFIIKAT